MLKKNGFTLIEMLLVVMIITTLVAMIAPRFMGRSQEAKIAAAKADIYASLSNALDLYQLDNGFFPTSEQGLDALKKNPTTAPEPKNWKGPYVKTNVIQDPWKNQYAYRSPGTYNRDYDLISYGPDGIEGGEDDISNWEQEQN